MAELDNAHALIIGIADYQYAAPLPAVKDAATIAAVLADPAYGSYRPANVRHLQDEQATRPAIRAALADLAGRTNRDSTVTIYFSGHGGRVRSGPAAGEYLLPIEADPGSDARLADSAIAGGELTGALRAIPARKLVVILDCCHAGGLGQPRTASAPTLVPGLSDDYFAQLQAGRGRVIMASARANEYAYVLDGAEYGLFTQHLVDGLRGGVTSDDGLVRIFDLFEYLQPRVTRDRPDQHPIFKAELEENFPIARYRGGEHGVMPRVDDDYRYDVYVSYVDVAPDSDWVWSVLLPRLEAAGLRVAVSNDSLDPGVARVVGIERGIQQAKRTLVVLSERYLADTMAEFENVLAMTIGLQEGSYRLVPVRIGPLEAGQLPVRLSMLASLDLTHPQRAEREFGRLITALQGPLPRR